MGTVKNALVLTATTDEDLVYIVSVLEDRLREWREDGAKVCQESNEAAALYNLLCDLGTNPKDPDED